MSGDVLVLGGTGKVGRRLVEAIREQGGRARAAGRRSGDVRFDWHDTGTWRDAVAGAEAIFIVGPGSGSDWSPLLAELLEVARNAGVTRTVLLSARAVEFHPDGVVAATERTLRASELAWTIVRPSHFAQNFTEAMFVPVDGIVAAPVGDGAEPFIDVADIAAVAASLLLEGGHDNETIELSGPEALTFPTAVAILAEATGRWLRFVEQQRDDHVAALRGTGTPELYVAWRMAMLDAIRTGDDAHVSTGVEKVLGRPATSFSAWAEQHRARGAGLLLS